LDYHTQGALEGKTSRALTSEAVPIGVSWTGRADSSDRIKANITDTGSIDFDGIFGTVQFIYAESVLLDLSISA
jgi:hypothetical protein